MTPRAVEIRRLKLARPRSRLVRASLLALAALAAVSWVDVAAGSQGVLSARRAENVARFLGEVRPRPLQGREFDLGIAAAWAGEILRDRGLGAMGVTLAISVAAAVLGGLLGLLISFPAARTFASPEPFAPGPRPPGPVRRGLHRSVFAAARSLCVLTRALPEYVLAFLLLAILGPSPWAAVLALAVHNAGILGRLSAETIENLPPGAPAAWRLLGAGRARIAAGAILPAVMPRFLLYFFYRWETAVREATVLGMLGVISLGSFIEDARSRNRYDEMFHFVLCGAFLVVAGDVVSAIARRVVRRAA